MADIEGLCPVLLNLGRSAAQTCACILAWKDQAWAGSEMAPLVSGWAYWTPSTDAAG